MPRPKREDYLCPCCDYSTDRKSSMTLHLYNVKKPCPKTVSDLELTDEIKAYILANRVYNPTKKIHKPSLLEEFANLKIENAVLKNKKDEKFYQLIVEKYLGATHDRNAAGVTDVTTDTIHAEIKRFKIFKEGIVQLMAYNVKDPKDELHSTHAYMFDDTGKKHMDMAADVMKQLKIKVFTFYVSNEKVDIIDYETKSVMFTHVI